MPTSNSHVKVMRTTETGHDWYIYHANVHRLLEYLADEGHSASFLVAVHEKPWKYREEYEAALAKEAADAG